MIQDTDLVFRDPYLDHNNSQAQKIHVFLNSMCVYTHIYIYAALFWSVAQP